MTCSAPASTRSPWFLRTLIGECAGSETSAGVVEKALRRVGGVLSCGAYETVKAMLKAESFGFVGCALIDLFSIFVCSAISEELAAGRPLVGELMQKASIMLVNERHLSMRMQTICAKTDRSGRTFTKKHGARCTSGGRMVHQMRASFARAPRLTWTK